MTSAIVRVFEVGLDPAPAPQDRFDGLLPPSERNAPAPVRTTRAAVRTVLAPLFGVDPAAVVIDRRCARCGDPAHGRPSVAGPVSFSASHSGARALIAVCTDGATVGVDIEAIRLRPRLPDLAARVLDPEQLAAWHAIADDDARLVAFLRVWTAKEAYLKAVGIGIATRLRDVPAEPPGWHVRPLDAPVGYVAVLATDQLCTVERSAISWPNAGTGR